MVVSVLVTFLLKVLKKVLSIVKSDHSNYSHQAQLTASESLQVQKENALTESALKAKCSLGDEHCIVKRKTLS